MLLLALSTGAWTGCASVGPPQAPSLELPKPVSDLKAVRKGDKVRLTWTIPPITTDRQTVRYLGSTKVCRGFAPLADCATTLGSVPPPRPMPPAGGPGSSKRSGEFWDTLSSVAGPTEAMGTAFYAVQVLNAAGRSAGLSNQARVPLVPALPAFPHFAAIPEEAGIRVSWQCPHSSSPIGGVKYFFRIQRTPDGHAKATPIAEVPATDCALIGSSGGKNQNSFLDQTFEWEQTYVYSACVVSVIESPGKTAIEVEGEDTPAIKIFAHDVFPPAVPYGVQAEFSGAGQAAFIDVVWTPAKDLDLEGYNVYRHEVGAAALKLNAGIVSAPAYRDAGVAAGRTYFYSISAVDRRGNESARSEEASAEVP